MLFNEWEKYDIIISWNLRSISAGRWLPPIGGEKQAGISGGSQ